MNLARVDTDAEAGPVGMAGGDRVGGRLELEPRAGRPRLVPVALEDREDRVAARLDELAALPLDHGADGCEVLVEHRAHLRSEERRVGKECRSRWCADQ